MAKVIRMDRKTGNGRYGDVMDAAQWLANGDYSSVANAIAVMVRQSALYKQAHEEIRANAEIQAPASGRRKRQTSAA